LLYPVYISRNRVHKISNKSVPKSTLSPR